jgi:hypothetical protein
MELCSIRSILHKVPWKGLSPAREVSRKVINQERLIGQTGAVC